MRLAGASPSTLPTSSNVRRRPAGCIAPRRAAPRAPRLTPPLPPPRAALSADESFAESITRHEYYLATRLGLQPSDTVLDIGCGIGGPLRNIGRFTGAAITGVTLNQYQVDRGNQLCAAAELSPRCKLVQADFHKLPFPDASFDHVYSIEACCHSPDRADVYREIFRVLKPGGMFVSYEWCLTKAHNPTNKKVRLVPRGRCRRARSGELAFTRYSFTSSRLCTNQSAFHSSGPSALPTLLQYYCMPIAQYTTPSPDLPFVCHTPYNIGNNNIV